MTPNFCILNEYSRFLCIFVFFIGFIIASITISKGVPKDDEDIQEKTKQMKEYFDQHLQENQEFFLRGITE